MALDIAILLDIALLLIFAKLFGELAERLRFPSLLGELVGGLIAGALLLVSPNAFLDELAGFGILFLFFMLGLTLRIGDIKKEFRPTLLVAIGGTAVSFVIGFLFGYFLFGSAAMGLFTGVAIMSTSTAISLRALHDAGELNTKVFQLASAASRIDDLITVLAITALMTVILGGVTVEAVLFSMIIVAAVFVALELWVSDAIARVLDMFERLQDEYVLVAIVLVVLFAVSFGGEAIGIGAATGAFLAGYALSSSRLTETTILPAMKTIGHGFFIPLFFAYAALSIHLGFVFASLGAVVVLFILAALAKFVGTAFLAWWEGHRGSELILLGSSMIPRGEFAIAITYLAWYTKFIGLELYSIVMTFVMLTIFVTPIAFRILKHRKFW